MKFLFLLLFTIPAKVKNFGVTGILKHYLQHICLFRGCYKFTEKQKPMLWKDLATTENSNTVETEKGLGQE